jgi:hypothetical protein
MNARKAAAWAIVAAVLICTGLCAVLIVDALFAGKAAQVQSKLDGSRADAAIATASDAANTVAGAAASADAIDATVSENRDAILAAPGANAPVDPRLRDAGLAGLCRHAAYRGSAQCVQFAPAN